jgi:predicted acylesterase/phospholipase RssA
MNSSINRALIFQGGGSLGAYEAGAYKAINEDLSAYFRTQGRRNEPIFHIVSGTSIGAINICNVSLNKLPAKLEISISANVSGSGVVISIAGKTTEYIHP